MDSKTGKLIYAIRDGIPVSIDDVDNGLKCGCICLACGETLVAKKGKKRMHHFAHFSGHSCEYGYESSLHLAAKEILAEANRITIPAVYVSFPDSHKEKELYCGAQEISVDRVELEKQSGNIIPDVVIYSGGKQFYLEVFVTHPIDENKLAKIKSQDVSTVEIDLSKKKKSISYDELREILLNDSEEKKWKYNSKEEKLLQRFYKAADKLKVISRGGALHIDDCPISMRVLRGKPYANFIDDCLGCEYCISHHAGDDGILCSGRAKVGALADLDDPDEVRKRISDEKKQRGNEAFVSGKCPYCGRKLVKREGRSALYGSCENYPRCRFMVTIERDTGKLLMKE